MLVYDDTATTGKDPHLRQGRDRAKNITTLSASSSSRIVTATFQIPRIEEKEPLFCECEHFVKCIKSGENAQY